MAVVAVVEARVVVDVSACMFVQRNENITQSEKNHSEWKAEPKDNNIHFDKNGLSQIALKKKRFYSHFGVIFERFAIISHHIFGVDCIDF